MLNVSNVLGTFANTYLSNTFRLSSIAYPNGQTTTFNYFGNDQDNRLQQLTHSITNSQLSTFQYTYDPDGQIATWTQQAGATTPKVWGLDYDPVDQLLGATIHSNSITGAILKSYFYGYDRLGNRLAEQIDSGVTAGNFNALNQLTNTINGGRVRFAGQLTNKPGTVLIGTNPATMGLGNTSFVGFAEVALGTNLVPITATDYAGHSSTNRYQIVVTNNAVAQTLTYDANGNLSVAVTATTTNTYAWDAADRLVRITQIAAGNANESVFTYDGLGRRVQISETNNGVLLSDKRFVWVGTELAEERDNTGTNVTKRFLGQGEQIGGTNYYFTRDHLGSVREMIGTNGVVLARSEYDPYGRRTRTEGTMDGDFGFTGHYYHPASGLHFTIFRAYDTDAGRWLNRDPIRESGGLDLYGYVSNDPVNELDLLGLWGRNDPPNIAIPLGNIPSSPPTLSSPTGSWSPVSMAHADAVTMNDVQFLNGMGAGQWAGTTHGAFLAASDQSLISVFLPMPLLGRIPCSAAAAEPAAALENASKKALDTLAKERRALDVALREDEIALQNARDLVDRIRRTGSQPNPYGLLQDLRSFEEGVVAKQQRLSEIVRALSQAANR